MEHTRAGIVHVIMRCHTIWDELEMCDYNVVSLGVRIPFDRQETEEIFIEQKIKHTQCE